MVPSAVQFFPAESNFAIKCECSPSKVVELELAVPSISHETIRQTLKNGMNNRKIQYWVIPPKNNAEFAANIEGCSRNI